MKQGTYQGIKNIEILDVEMPTIEDDGVLIKNICSSICGTDVSAYFHGGEVARIQPGDEFGHEMISEVVKVGKNVTDIKVGQRVYPLPLFAKADMSRSGTVGGYSEYIEIPHFKKNLSLFEIDDSITDEEGCLIEPFTVGYHAAKLTHPTPEKNAIVFGAGMIGMACAICLKHIGIKDVIITDISDYRLDVAKKLGFKVCNVAKNDIITYSKEIFGDFRGKPNVDIYIDAAGIASNIDLFVNNAKFGATLCVTAVHYKPLEIDFMKVTFGQLNIVGSPAYEISDVFAVIEMLKSKQFDIASLITQKYPLDKLEEAINKAADSQSSLKVIIDYR